MRRIIFFVVFWISFSQIQAENSLIFYGGSYNFTVSSQNLFIGVNLDSTGSLAAIGNWYGKDIFSADLLIRGVVFSFGFNSELKNQFITMLWTEKVCNFGNKGKIFLKVGFNWENNLKQKSFYQNLSPIIGFGYRWY